MTKNDKQEFWFKQRSHIWEPATWQGWAVIVVFLAIVIGNATVMYSSPYSNGLLWLYLNVLITSVIAIIVIAYAKGPAPKKT